MSDATRLLEFKAIEPKAEETINFLLFIVTFLLIDPVRSIENNLPYPISPEEIIQLEGT
tara:strand:- start:652 stop:828 length:177 start_codon:yes stop_codon:yes gene_type:complete